VNCYPLYFFPVIRHASGPYFMLLAIPCVRLGPLIYVSARILMLSSLAVLYNLRNLYQDVLVTSFDLCTINILL
jgi:hypothetical protein